MSRTHVVEIVCFASEPPSIVARCWLEGGIVRVEGERELATRLEGRQIEGMTPDRGVGYLAALPVLLGGDGFTHARRVRESWPPDEYTKQWWAWDPMFAGSGRG